jgi:acyl-CoA reductase-like NAD-dependent aldehyde dehydrogenase
MANINTISPTTGACVVTRPEVTEYTLETLANTATEAFQSFRKTALSDRKEYVRKALEILEAQKDELAAGLTTEMGRPIAYTPSEITTAIKRGQYLLKVSDEALADTPGEPEEKFKRYIKKVPVGPVLIIFPWNVSF